ncbi:hypothetical protein COCMIDRAFT_33622 [Bipolaris oryzae ATCC 44560]|uniref:Uncharacterized protein n=1 Tax=Bipolaris oryzae ATCC 44560 TaxID=930090 RepID=W6ZAZ4_COCMI|nr:uncharacterized protein COCMIDRAFT_33622 [Bipolaris oryzae ATCC 44560]EUC48947.1 hypothetical protein COCMIDRAFT_33622 [Bipolaris oryzae ATCC 44560]
MARTRSNMRQSRALAVDFLFWNREVSRERWIAYVVVNGTEWANTIAPLPDQLPDRDGTHVQCWHTQLHIEHDVAAKPIQTTETQNAVPRQTQMGLPPAVESRLSAAASCRRQKPNQARSKVGRRSVFTSFPPSFGGHGPEMLLIFRPKHGADTTSPAPPFRLIPRSASPQLTGALQGAHVPFLSWNGNSCLSHTSSFGRVFVCVAFCAFLNVHCGHMVRALSPAGHPRPAPISMNNSSLGVFSKLHVCKSFKNDCFLACA